MFSRVIIWLYNEGLFPPDEAVLPFITRSPPPLPSAPDTRSYSILFCGFIRFHLTPSGARFSIKYSDITAGKELQGFLDMVTMVHLSTPFFAKHLKPRRIDKVRNERATNFVTELVIFTSVTDLVGIQEP